MKNQIFLLFSAVFLTGAADIAIAAPACPIIPLPAEVKMAEGTFSLTPETVIVAPKSLENEANALRDLISPATGMELAVLEEKTDGAQILLALDPSLKDLGSEGYTLQVLERGAVIKSSSAAGVFYGIQSLLQLLPAEIVSTEKVDANWEIPFVSISDQPRFAWRAFMLDEARYFKGETEVRKMLDQMAALKMNVFHWHLTDDQGWRIEIKKYPKLTTIGSKRTDTQIGGWDSPGRSGEAHGGFYTQEQIKEIVAYAAARHITVVPEIGMPGHACAAFAAYPVLGTTKKEIDVMVTFGKAQDTYDPSVNSTYEFLSNVLDEVIELFPSKIIHIGGDEVRFDQWKESKSVAELMKREKLETMADVQLYFTNRMAGIVQEKGRNIMGWNEILGDDLHGFLKDGQTAKSGSLDKNTIVHFWRGSPELAKRAIKDGHTIVNSLHSSTYLDYSYANISLEKAYDFNPILGGLSKDEEARIIGLGCQMWGEWIPTVADMDRQIFPRIAAYAEVGWTPLERKDSKNFSQRMKKQTQRWQIQNIGYAAVAGTNFAKEDFFNHTTVDTWKPETVSTESKPMEFSTDGQIKANGTYEVAFVYEKGAHALSISSVELLKNGETVATDKHPAMSGTHLVSVVYELKLDSYEPGAEYTLKAIANGSGGNDSSGEVKMRAGE